MIRRCTSTEYCTNSKPNLNLNLMTFNCWCEQLVFGDQQERATIMYHEFLYYNRDKARQEHVMHTAASCESKY